MYWFAIRASPRRERAWEALTLVGRPPGVAWTRVGRELFWLVASAHELGSDPT